MRALPVMKILNDRLFDLSEVAAMIADQLEDRTYSYSDNIRTAAMCAPYTMTTAQWVAACDLVCIKRGTAYYSIADVRKFQREIGEIK